MLKRREFAVYSGAIALGTPLWRSADGATIASSDSDANRAGPVELELAGSPTGPWRRLFLDATTIEQQSGLDRVFHSAEKHSHNPLLVANRPWEGTSAIIGPYVYGTVFREGTRLRMWYQVLYQGNHVGYAESEDGVTWTKPDLQVISHGEWKKNNLVVSAFSREASGGGNCHNPSVIRCPNDSETNRRYALYGFDGQVGHARVAYSADGLRWQYPDSSQPKPLFKSSDVVNFFYDPYQARYFCTWKTRNRRGRAVGIAVSRDGVHWDKPIDAPVFVADDHDPDATQIYGMPVFPYQGLYIGLPWIYRARYFRYGEYSVDKLHEAQSDSPRTMETQMAWSWDLVNWSRPPLRGQFIARGNEQAWDRGMIVTARAPVIVGDKLYFYYGGTDKVHDEKRVRAAIGLATLRLDGFCSMRCTGSSVGWLITRREPFQEPVVTINAKTAIGGSISAEILDRQNRVVPGFSRDECLAFSGDSTSHRLRWKTGSFQPKIHPDYKIRFWLHDAELFSYLPERLNPDEPDLARFQSTGP